jgi:hypothetical protein
MAYQLSPRLRFGLKLLGAKLAISAALAVALMSSGCGLLDTARPRPLSVVVGLDETSFAETYWDPSVRAAQAIVLDLNPRDRIQVNAISVCSNDDNAVLLKDAKLPLTLSAGTYFAKNEARQTALALGQMKRRVPNGNGTDIVGALRNAAAVFERNAAAPAGADYPTYQPVLVLCSDMQPDDHKPLEEVRAQPFVLPPDTRVRCLFVVKELPPDLSGRPQPTSTATDPELAWNKLVDMWVKVFAEVGVKVTRADFKKVEESTVAAPNRAPALREFLHQARYH